MIPQIKAKFRKKNGVPYAVERFAGVQEEARGTNENGNFDSSGFPHNTWGNDVRARIE